MTNGINPLETHDLPVPEIPADQCKDVPGLLKGCVVIWVLRLRRVKDNVVSDSGRPISQSAPSISSELEKQPKSWATASPETPSQPALRRTSRSSHRAGLQATVATGVSVHSICLVCWEAQHRNHQRTPTEGPQFPRHKNPCPTW